MPLQQKMNVCRIFRYIVKNYISRPEVWTYAERYESRLPTHGNNTSNFIESSFNVLKSSVFNRQKAFNIVELWDKLKTSSDIYKQKCINIGNGRMNDLRQKGNKYDLKDVKIKKEDIIQISENSFLVSSQTNENLSYEVNMQSGLCECFKGVNLGPCAHKNAVALHFGVSGFNVLPVLDAGMRGVYHYIAQRVNLCYNPP